MLSKIYTKVASQVAGIDVKVFTESTLIHKLQYDSNNQSVYKKIKKVDRKHLIV